MSSLVKNLLFALGLAILLWLGYALFLKGDSSLVTSSNSQVQSQAALAGQDFLNKLQQIRKFDIKGSLFNDSRFTSLVDTRQDIGSEPAGRTNPFAPVQ
jgi:threonine/homoserine/homoserine lactone efflux protein